MRSSYSSAMMATSRMVVVSSSCVERVAAQQRVREDDDVAGRHVGEGAEAQEGVHLQQLERQRHLHRHPLDQLGDAADHAAVRVPGDDVDHHDGRSLLDDVETLVDLLERGALAQGLLDELAARLGGGVHVQIGTTDKVNSPPPCAPASTARTTRADHLASVRRAGSGWGPPPPGCRRSAAGRETGSRGHGGLLAHPGGDAARGGHRAVGASTLSPRGAATTTERTVAETPKTGALTGPATPSATSTSTCATSWTPARGGGA